MAGYRVSVKRRATVLNDSEYAFELQKPLRPRDTRSLVSIGVLRDDGSSEKELCYWFEYGPASMYRFASLSTTGP